MRKILALVPLLILIVSISGCIEGGGFAGLMGVGPQEKEAPNDILQIKKTKVIPTPPIPAGNTFTFTFQLENLDEKKSAEGVGISLYDTGRCSIEERVSHNKGQTWTMFPGATKLLKWEIEAPTNKQLGNMAGECPLRYKASYIFDAHTRADAIVASQAKIEEASRKDETIQVSPTESKSRGPVKVDVRFASEQPLRNGSVVPFDVIVQNKGSGEVRELVNGDVTIIISGIEDLEEDFNQWDVDGDKNNCRYPNHDESSKSDTQDNKLPFIGDETPPIRCTYEFTGQEAPLKTYTIKVDIPDYGYTISGKKTVEITPTYQG